MTDYDFTAAGQRAALDRVIKEMVRGGKDVNEVLAMPYHFLTEILREEVQEAKKESSLIAAFGGRR